MASGEKRAEFLVARAPIPIGHPTDYAAESGRLTEWRVARGERRVESGEWLRIGIFRGNFVGSRKTRTNRRSSRRDSKIPSLRVEFLFSRFSFLATCLFNGGPFLAGPRRSTLAIVA